MPDTPLAGVYAILATTFHDDGSIDLDSQLRLVDFLLAEGAHGLGLFGNASEGYTLLNEERTELLKAIVRRVDGRVPLVVSTGHTGTDAAVRLSREAQDLGAQALMVLPPYFLRPDGDGIFFYFEAISKAISIPIMVQDAPLMSQVNLPPALLSRMAREIEHVRYAKIEAPPTAPKITAVREAAGDAMVLFGGLNGQFFIEEHERGSRGVMPGSDMTCMYASVWSKLEAGDTKAAWEVFMRALPLIRFELQPGRGVSAMKHNLNSAGIIASTRVRHPTTSLEPASIRELEALRTLLSRNGQP